MAKQYITGLSLRKRLLRWTILCQKKSQAEIEGHGEVELDLDGDTVDMSAPETVTALKKACSFIKGEVGVGLSTDLVLLRVVELPTVEPDEIEGMVDLQVDKFSPFPAEHMAVSHEVLVQKESSTRVLIAAVKREQVDQIGEAFTQAGHVPHWVDVDILGWWQLLADAGAIAAEGRQAVLLIDEGVAELVVAQDGVPVLFRSLGAHMGLSAEEEIDELVEEVGYTFTSLEAEWGTAARVQLNAWTSEDLPPALVARLKTECGLDVERHPLSELPPVTEGLARRCKMRGERVNLAPTGWQEGEQSRNARKILIALSVVFFMLWIGALTVFFVALNMQNRRRSELESEYEGLAVTAQQVKDLETKVKSLEEYADRSRSALECLREISAAMPSGVDLTLFAYKKGRTVNIRGEAENETPIYDFIATLEKSDMFVEVKPEGISSSRRRGRIVTEFKLTAKLPGEEI